MPRIGEIKHVERTGQSVYELMPETRYEETYWILASNFQEASDKAAKIVERLKDKIGSLDLQGTIDA